MKKRTIGFVAIVIFLSVEFYWYHKYDGNVILIVQNQSRQDYEEIDLKVELNDVLLQDTVLSFNRLLPVFGIRGSYFGNSKVGLSSSKLQVDYSKRIYTFPVTWLMLDYESNGVVKIRKSYWPVVIQ